MSAPALLSNYTAEQHAAALLADLNAFLSEHPVVGNEDEYREGVTFSKLARKCIADADDERKREIAPLSLEVGKINHRFKEKLAPLTDLLKVMDERMTAFAKAQERRRADEAAAKAKAADEAGRRAHEAAQKLAAAREDAEAGVVGVDLLTANEEARKAAVDASKADRERQRAERDQTFRVSSPGERAVSMRNRTEYTVTDAVSALTEMGSNDDIDAEIVKRAKAWAKLNGRLPNGVTTHVNRSL